MESAVVCGGPGSKRRRFNEDLYGGELGGFELQRAAWRFLVGRRGDATYAKILDALIGFNQDWAKAAPVLILTAGKKTFMQNGKPNDYAIHDTGAASACLSLEAAALGLHTHGMAGFDKEKARASFGVPEDFDIGAVWALGYLGDPGALPEQMKQMELAPRTRKGLSEFVFAGWGESATL